MQNILLSLFPLILFIISGYVLKRSAFLHNEFWIGAEKLNYYFLFPAMLFANLASATIEFEMVKSIVMMLLVMLILLILVLYLFKYFLNIPPSRFGVYVQSNVRFNTYMGLAIVASLFPQQGMALFAILLAISIPIVNVISVISLTEKEGMQVKTILLSLIKNPLIMSCLIGALFNLAGFSLWSAVRVYLQQLAVCSLVLGLMCIGAALQFLALKKDLVPLLLNTLSRLLIIPLLAYWITAWLDVSVLETQIFVIYFALPTASASYILTKVLGGDSQLMAGVISLQTLCSAITLTLVLLFIGS